MKVFKGKTMKTAARKVQKASRTRKTRTRNKTRPRVSGYAPTRYYCCYSVTHCVLLF